MTSEPVVCDAGTDGSLMFYWAVNGTSTWNEEIVAGADTTASAPSMTTNGNAVNISTVGTNNQLMFYWALNGSGAWHPVQVSGPGSVGNL